MHMIRLLMVFCLLLGSGPVLAWRVAESAHFRVFTQGSAASARKQAALLEDFRDLLILATGQTPPEDSPKLDVYVVSDLQAATPGQTLPPTVAGFYRATPGGIAAISGVGGGNRSFAQAVLLHEYAHHFMLSDTRNAYPAWYVEGFAEYFMTARFEPGRIEFGHVDQNRLAWLLNTPWLPAERLLAGSSEMLRSADVAMFYAQSWLLTHWLFRTEGMTPKLRAYLVRTARGEDPVKAFQTEIEPNLGALNRSLRRYLKSGRNFTFSRLQREGPKEAAVTVFELPKSADGVLLKLLAIEQRAVPPATGQALVSEFREAVALAPDDPFLARALAKAELVHGDPMAARVLLDRLVAAEPADPALRRWQGMAILATGGDISAARRAYAAAFEADPNDWRTLLAWARTFPPDRLTDRQLEVVLRAHALAPQVSEAILMAAVALAHRGRMADAAAVLRPLAFAPHGGRLSEKAEELLLLAAAGNRPGFLAAIRPLEAPSGSE
jgi:tetratricopeptide (TPR) repeat protein